MKKVKKICIDPGHGGSDPGAVNGAFTEKYANLEISKFLKDELVTRGYEVGMTRIDDIFHTPNAKARLGNEYKADIFVSIHCNASESEKAHGTETLAYDMDGESYKLASAIQRCLIQKTGLADRGVKERKDLIVLNSTIMPAVLVETAFISNQEEKMLLMSSAFRKNVAIAISDGIDEYFGEKRTLKEMNIEQAKEIIKSKCGFDENTMLYLSFYKYSESMIIRLAQAMS